MGSHLIIFIECWFCSDWGKVDYWPFSSSKHECEGSGRGRDRTVELLLGIIIPGHCLWGRPGEPDIVPFPEVLDGGAHRAHHDDRVEN